jgi:hypothetical protein
MEQFEQGYVPATAGKVRHSLAFAMDLGSLLAGSRQ